MPKQHASFREMRHFLVFFRWSVHKKWKYLKIHCPNYKNNQNTSLRDVKSDLITMKSKLNSEVEMKSHLKLALLTLRSTIWAILATSSAYLQNLHADFAESNSFVLFFRWNVCVKCSFGPKKHSTSISGGAEGMYTKLACCISWIQELCGVFHIKCVCQVLFWPKGAQYKHLWLFRVPVYQTSMLHFVNPGAMWCFSYKMCV